MYGLLERDMNCIIEILRANIEIEEAIIFGSRAMGNYKKGSDVDIALKGLTIDKKTILNVWNALNEVYPLPYFFDVVNYNELSNEALKHHIDTEGKVVYKKEIIHTN